MIYYLRASTSSVDSLSLDGSDGDLLPEFVSTAHANVRREFIVPIIELDISTEC